MANVKVGPPGLSGGSGLARSVAHSLHLICSKIHLLCKFFSSCPINSLMGNGMDLGRQNWGLALLFISNLAVKSFMVPNSFQKTSQCFSRISDKD